MMRVMRTLPCDPPEGCTFCHSGRGHCGDELVAGAGGDTAARITEKLATFARLAADIGRP